MRDEAEYGGVRVRMTATIAGARVPIQVDVGFGDAITPKPIEVEYPALLDAPPPRLLAYPPETVVAEKFEALVTLGVANSRMKDFYDLWMIAQTFQFDRALLASALRRTFERRRTPWPAETPTGLSEAFAADKKAQWRAFLGRERLGAAPEAFSHIIENFRSLLLPLMTQDGGASRWLPGDHGCAQMRIRRRSRLTRHINLTLPHETGRAERPLKQCQRSRPPFSRLPAQPRQKNTVRDDVSRDSTRSIAASGSRPNRHRQSNAFVVPRRPIP